MDEPVKVLTKQNLPLVESNREIYQHDSSESSVILQYQGDNKWMTMDQNYIVLMV